MKERFKKYLEKEYRAIRPTLAAAEYRQDVLAQLLDRAQELKIKGMTDEELIYSMCIGELGDFAAKLKAFDEREQKIVNVKNKALLSVAIIAGAVLALTIVYLVTSFATNAWGTTWLIMVGGIFAGVIAGAGIGIGKLNKSGKENKNMLIRGLAIVINVLLCVFIFLLMQILFTVEYSWLIFLAMVIAIVGIDTLLAFAFNFKLRFLELGAFAEVLCALLYVILGITGVAPWHPTWILCLGGVLVAIIMLAVLANKRKAIKEKDEGEKIVKKYVRESEDYYTMWKD